ncbi:oxygen-independent coproporphyrinogen III oxidase [Sphingorhabdus sp.]|uniref:oxygen-independent coproporphyrinogen III oxidase n=1 Tax=Sphingorhabdus sp. TaxID=1902408 RepID=UPI0032B72B29
MWPYFPDLLARPVPRYTSYPPATQFIDKVGADAQAKALNAVVSGTPISLYAHIPYCQSICWYCGCNTGAAGRTQRLHAYLEALEGEMAMVAKMLGGRGKLQRIAFGGGSPNAIEPIAFVRLVDRLVTMFSGNSPDISVEIDPRAFSLEWAMTLAVAQVSRVSFGVQSFEPDIQAAIGRVQPVEMIETCMASLRARGIKAINFDLMYGLPHQTNESLLGTLNHVARMRPSRIALFGYAHVPHIFPRQKRIDTAALPGIEARFEQAAIGYERLVSEGYVPVGFDHFALPDDSLAIAAAEGKVRRNFQGFTEDQSDVLIGFGASAISQFPDAIIQNEKNPGAYREIVGAHQLAGRRGLVRDVDDQLRAQLIERLLCTGRADTTCLLNDPASLASLRQLEERRLIIRDGNTIVLTEAGRPYARVVAALFDTTLPVLGTGSLAA